MMGEIYLELKNSFSKLYIIITIGILLGAFSFYSTGQLITGTQMIFLCFLEIVACFCALIGVKFENKKSSQLCVMVISVAFLISHCYGFVRGIATGGDAIQHSVFMSLLGDCIIYVVIGIIICNTLLKRKNA